MALRNIVQIGDETLRKISFEVTDFGEKTSQLLDDMKETLENRIGAGLAVVQVGVLKKVFIININNMQIEFVNPEIIDRKGEQYKKEGCLSVGLPFGYVKRPQEVTIKAFDRYGNKFTLTCEDWTAVCVCHEFDHLNGELYIDKTITPPAEFIEEDEE
mgnify:CR=1 FL=1